MILALSQFCAFAVGLMLTNSAGRNNCTVPRASLNYLSIYIAEAKGFSETKD
jgi:hypothetical protein